DEWVISRVFQKSGSGGSSVAGGGKKTRLNPGINLFPEVSSPSSVSLPPLLDSSPFATASSASVTDRDSYSYNGAAAKEHVPCFSTNINTANFSNHAPFELPPPPPPAHPHVGGLQAFPNLKALQENLQMPSFFFSTVAPPPMQGGGDMGGWCSVGSWPPPPEEQKMESARTAMGSTELDCLWSC
ncbi:hypothetical protein U1Q18_000719, partial [Sarracenia purpurea var. burkii]